MMQALKEIIALVLGVNTSLRFLAPDVTIEWEERSKVSTGESTSELDCDITGESTRENT